MPSMSELIPSLPKLPNAGKGVFNMIVLLGMILYVISPIDLILDVLFPVGFIDDALILLAGCSYLGFDFLKMIGARK
ncbi:MAG: DUF1232 domain-containing protein [Thermoplasmata archaeon]|nr:DUF1232 domain-containing protein [Thermoplasmata archaeon]